MWLFEMESIDFYSVSERSTSWQLYKILTIITVIYCVFSLAALIVSTIWPISVYLPLVMLTMSVLSVVHVLTQRHLCATVQLIHQYYAAAVGFLYGAITVICSIILMNTGWKYSNWLLQCLYIMQLLIGFAWMYLWLAIVFIRILRESAIQKQGGGDYSVLLLFRCGCVPSESKKMIIYSPFCLLGIFFLLESMLTRDLSCDMPLRSFCAISGAIFLILSIFSYLLLHVKREATIDNTQPDEILLMPRINSAFGVLLLFRLFCLFGLIWSFIGYDWLIISGPNCNLRIFKVSKFCFYSLCIGSILAIFFSICCKLESCFPTRLDPKLFETDDSTSNRSSSRSVNGSTGISRSLFNVLAMFIGFLVANPDLYEIEEYDGLTNI